jgi:hypothetical protein
MRGLKVHIYPYSHFKSNMSSSQVAALFISAEDVFFHRQFKEGAPGRIYQPLEDFVGSVNEFYNANPELLLEGDKPFKRHMFIPAEGRMDYTILPVTEENSRFLITEYQVRREGELPFLRRYFKTSCLPIQTTPKAAFINVEMYSAEKLEEEDKAQGSGPLNTVYTSPWVIVSARPTMSNTEVPPPEPHTILRDALGVEHGGSGGEFAAKRYQESCAFWKKHAFMA